MKNSPLSASSMPRRDFVKTSFKLALGAGLSSTLRLTAAERTRSVGANDRLRIGIIGCGERGRTALMEGIHQHLAATNFEIVAVCDPWRVARELANAKVKEWFGRDARQFDSYRELFAIKDLDAVMIASCDHQHTTHLEAAARAGVHAYVEKPLATDLAQLNRAVDAVKAAGTVVQVGTQLRSLPGIVGARALYRTGIFGKISRVEECRNMEKPYWYNYLGRDVKEADVNWQEFLQDRPARPFRAEVYAGWYGHTEFSQGPVAQWGAHYLDLVHFITGAQFPESCVCTGGTFTWQDDRFTNPDCVQATWIYPEGFLVSSANNLGNGYGNVRRLYGDKGVLKLDNWNAPSYSAQGGARRDGTIRGEPLVEPVPGPDHFLNWLQCMRDGGTPNASIDAGYQHAVAVLMATRSYETGRKTFYDRQQRTIRTS